MSLESHRSLRRLRFTPGQADLLHQADQIVEEPLLDDLAMLIPMGDGAELDFKFFVRRRNRLAVGALHRPLHRAGKFRHRAGPIALSKEHLVRIIRNLVVGKGLKEFDCLLLVRVPSPCCLRFAGPENGDVLGVALPERLPVVLSDWSFIPP